MTVTCHSRAEFTATIAALVREGVGFRAVATSDGTYTIEMTGAY